MTELENMLSGRLYLAGDAALSAARLRAQTLCRRYNDTFPGQLEQRRDILRQLLGTVGDECCIEPTFRCDYGSQITIGDCFVFAASDAVLFFAICIACCYLHHLAHGDVACWAELQVQISVPHACLEGADCLMLCDVLHRVVESCPTLNEITQGLILLLDAVLELHEASRALARPFEGPDEHSGQIYPAVDA